MASNNQKALLRIIIKFLVPTSTAAFPTWTIFDRSAKPKFHHFDLKIYWYDEDGQIIFVDTDNDFWD